MKEITRPGIPVMGNIPPIKHATTRQIVEYIAQNQQDVLLRYLEGGFV